MARKKSTQGQFAELQERRWTAADARVILEAQARSGMSLSAFARRHGLSDKRIYSWRKQLSTMPESKPSPEVSFAPVVVTGAGNAAVAMVVRAGEMEVEVIDPSRVDPAWLVEFFSVVGRP